MWRGSGCPCGGVQRPRGALGDLCCAVRPEPGSAWRDFSRPKGPSSATSLSHAPQWTAAPRLRHVRASVSQWGRSVRARGSAPRSPAATAASTREARQGRSRVGLFRSFAASPRRGPQRSWSAAPGTRRRNPRQRRVLSRRLQVPSQSAPRACWLPVRLWARAARGGGTARGWGADGRAEGGVSSLGMGKAGRGGGQSCPTLQTAPSPDRGRAPCLLAISLSLCVPSRSGMDGSSEAGATGGFRSLLVGGVGVGFLVTVVIAGVL